ncbi:class I SAM-dependent methyltransferase [Psychromonas sp. MME2]|uniref:class I SAM-dependent methyltransferase n=1 Tax=unclassified Psychromonas TaxID=2614957 RepID=UPI00339C8EDB
MKRAKTTRILTSIDDWQQLPNGNKLLYQTQLHIDNHLPKCFGSHLLKLGQLSCQLNTSRSPIPHQISCAANGNAVTLIADLHQLPFQDCSIDLCVLAHELDFSSDPHQLLREIDRVLALDGTLIISGYNPISLFGLRTLVTEKKSQRARLFFPNRVIDWLHLLGFEIKQKQHFDFIANGEDGQLSAYIEKIGQQFLPYLCSVYFIIAKKQSIPMTPIKSHFEFKKTIIAEQAAVTRQR